MTKEDLLIACMNEGYVQARQHETRQTASMSFLTPAAFVVLGVAFGAADGTPRSPVVCGIIVILIGATSWWINRSHNKGRNFYIDFADLARDALEQSIGNWNADGSDKPRSLRNQVVRAMKLSNDDKIDRMIYRALRLVPMCVMAAGVVTVLIGWYQARPVHA
jgi:hypothetical protein